MLDVTLPTGAQVQFRAMTVKEQDALLSCRPSNWLETLVAMMEKCTVSVIDQGPYTEFNWLDTYEGDGYMGLIQFRKASHPDPYVMNKKCSHCGEGMEVEIDIDDLEIIPPSDAVMEIVRQGETRISVPFKEHILELRVPTIRQVIKLKKSQALTKKRLKARKKGSAKIDLEGTQLRDNLLNPVLIGIKDMTPKDFKEWLDNSPASYLPELKDLIDSISFGVDSDLVVTCDCGSDEEFTAPLSPDFYLPLRKKKKKLRK